MAKTPVGASEGAQSMLAAIIGQATASTVGSDDINTLTNMLILANKRFTTAWDSGAKPSVLQALESDVVALTKAVNLARNRAGLAQIG